MIILKATFLKSVYSDKQCCCLSWPSSFSPRRPHSEGKKSMGMLHFIFHLFRPDTFSALHFIIYSQRNLQLLLCEILAKNTYHVLLKRRVELCNAFETFKWIVKYSANCVSCHNEHQTDCFTFAFRVNFVSLCLITWEYYESFWALNTEFFSRFKLILSSSEKNKGLYLFRPRWKQKYIGVDVVQIGEVVDVVRKYIW